jgi:hypothetical protein
VERERVHWIDADEHNKWSKLRCLSVCECARLQMCLGAAAFFHPPSESLALGECRSVFPLSSAYKVVVVWWRCLRLYWVGFPTHTPGVHPDCVRASLLRREFSMLFDELRIKRERTEICVEINF